MLQKIRRWSAERKCRQGSLPDDICSYITSSKARPNGKLPIGNVRFVVLDTETSGLDVEKDEVLSIGAVALVGRTIDLADAFEVLLRSERPPIKKNVEIHGILPSISRIAVERTVALRQFLTFLQGSIIIAHHAAFDVGILSSELQRLYGITLYNEYIDTVHLAVRLEHSSLVDYEFINKADYSLDSLIRRYNIPVSGRHTASGDALVTAQLFLKLLQEGRKRGITTLGEIRKTQKA